MSTEAENLMTSKQAGKIIATAFANALHDIGAEAVTLLWIQDGEVTRATYGDPEKAKQMAANYAAHIMTQTIEKLTIETEKQP
jgi:hypothetical protein